jgi:hypothetical protein
MLILFLYTLIISVIAFVYAVILVDQDMILFEFKAFLYRKIGKYRFIFKPLIDCEYCVSGQLGFWFYLYLTLLKNNTDFQYNILTHVFIISFCIFNVAIIKRLKIYGQ